MSKRVVSNKWTHEIYLQKITENHIPVELLEEYVDYQTKIKHRCINCGSDLLLSPVMVMAYYKKGMALCQECGGRSLRKGKNDLWTTDPEIAKMLANPEEGYELSRGSSKKVNWICPNCNTKILQKSVSNTVKGVLICPLCSNGRSKGHRLVNAILEYCRIQYENECSFPWSQNKRYDVYANKNCIIEINGEQHYQESYLLVKSNKTLNDQIANDLLKKNLATENGISHYIYVDARESDFGYIVDKLKQNDTFIDYIDQYGDIKFQDIEWNEILKLCGEPILWKILDMYKAGYMIKDIMNTLKCSHVAVERYLHLLNDYGFCTYDGYSQVCRKVICLTTGEEFNSMTEAANKYGIKPVGIYRVCNNLFNRTTAGKLPDGTRLKWSYAS